MTSAERAALEHLCDHLAGVANTALERLTPREAFDAFVSAGVQVGLETAGKSATLAWLDELARNLIAYEPK